MTERPRRVFRASARPGWSAEMTSDAQRARKRIRDVQVEFATVPGEVATPEGTVHACAGDAIVTAATGERWCMSAERFAGKYRPVPPTRMGESGRYRSLPIEILARRMDEPFEVILSDGRSRLRGKPGDWLVDYGDGTLGIVAQSIFPGTYDLIG